MAQMQELIGILLDEYDDIVQKYINQKQKNGKK